VSDSGGLGTLLAEYETWLAVERGVAANTLAAYRRDLRSYTRFLADRGLDDPAMVGSEPAGTEAVAAFVEHLKTARGEDGRTRFKPASVARALVAVRSFHRFCLVEGHLSADPSEDVTAPRVPQGIPKALAEGEIEALLAVVAIDDVSPGPVRLRDRAILETLYGTGMRISELVGLDLSALDLEDGLLRAFGKGAKERVVPMGRAASAAIVAWLPARLEIVARARRGDPDAVFVNPRGGRLTRQGCWKIVQRHGLRAGLGGRLSPHVLRHSCATHMVDRGADLRVVQELLGHASVSTTQVYTKVTQSRLRAVYDAAHPRARTLPFPTGDTPEPPGPSGGPGRLDLAAMADVTNATLRAQLEREQTRIRSQLEQMGHGGIGMAFDEGFADSGQVTAERGEVEALAGTLLDTLAEVEHALEKFDAGGYGQCERCGQPIAEDRLEAKPAARLCMSCASSRR